MMNTSTRRIGALTAIAALVLVAIWYVGLFHPETKKLASAHKAHAAAEQKIGSLQSQVTQLQQLERQIPSDSAKFAVLGAAIPDTPDLSTALNQLHQAAVTSGVTLMSVGPTAPTTGSPTGQPSQGGPPSIAVSLSASGSYQQVVKFLSLLAQMPRIVVVQSVNLSGQQQRVSASIAAKIFYAGKPTP